MSEVWQLIAFNLLIQSCLFIKFIYTHLINHLQYWFTGLVYCGNEHNAHTLKFTGFSNILFHPIIIVYNKI